MTFDPTEQIWEKALMAQQRGELEGAIALFDSVIVRRANFAEAYYKRANAKAGLGRLEGAVADYDSAIALNATYANAYCNRGAVLERLHRFEEALASCDRAIAFNPQDAFAFYNRGSVLKAMERYQEALSSYEQAITMKPDYVEAYINRGNLLQELQAHEQAIASYSRAVELNPAFAGAYQGRGASRQSLKLFEGAIADYMQALALDPNRDFLLGLRVHAQMHVCDWRGLQRDRQILVQGLRMGRRIATPFTVLALEDSPELHQIAAKIWSQTVGEPDKIGVVNSLALRAPKIRVGYFSPDFRAHAVGTSIAELIEAHDRARFEFTAFAIGPPVQDDVTSRLKRAFDRFVDVGDRSDRQVALLAREAALDIAVDLAGFTEHSRPGIFAHRAAPIQVNYLGYPGTTGSGFIDYVLGDHVIVPAGHEQYYSEKLVFLPNSYLPNDSSRQIGERQVSRVELGLPAEGFIYCCFNNSYKITPEVFSRWMRILHRTEGSVLWLAHGNVLAAANLRKEAARQNIDPQRLVFAERLPSSAEHLARQRTADLFLDTLPYNAHATAMDALWAGLPVLTQSGQAFAGRVAASLLTVLGMPELICDSAVEYEDRAVRLAMDPRGLAEIRQKLAGKRNSASLFDSRLLARHLESAYATMYARGAAGMPPESFNVAPEAC